MGAFPEVGRLNSLQTSSEGDSLRRPLAKPKLWYVDTVGSAQLHRVHRVTVDPTVVRDTLDVLRQFGSRRLEGLVLWLGDIEEDQAHVYQFIVPEQQSISDEEGVGYFVSGETLFRLNRALAESGLRLIAQIHSHPREAYHSEADDRFAIVTADGGLSLVVPDFGNAPEDPSTWAVYRLSRGQWIELDTREAQR